MFLLALKETCSCNVGKKPETQRLHVIISYLSGCLHREVELCHDWKHVNVEMRRSRESDPPCFVSCLALMERKEMQRLFKIILLLPLLAASLWLICCCFHSIPPQGSFKIRPSGLIWSTLLILASPVYSVWSVTISLLLAPGDEINWLKGAVHYTSCQTQYKQVFPKANKCFAHIRTRADLHFVPDWPLGA